MSFYTCDECNEKHNYSKIDGKAEYEIEKLDLRFCSFECMKNWFKRCIECEKD